MPDDGYAAIAADQPLAVQVCNRPSAVVAEDLYLTFNAQELDGFLLNWREHWLTV